MWLVFVLPASMASVLSGALTDAFGTVSNLMVMYWPFILIGMALTVAGVLIARVQGR